jgi:hypothetical protein
MLGTSTPHRLEQRAAGRARDADAPTTADLVGDQIRDTPGNAAVYRLRDVQDRKAHRALSA